MRLLKFGKFIYHFLLNFLIHLDERTGTKRTHLTRQQNCLPKCPSCKISLRSYLDWTLIVHEEGQFVFFMFTFWLRSKDSFFSPCSHVGQYIWKVGKCVEAWLLSDPVKKWSSILPLIKVKNGFPSGLKAGSSWCSLQVH